MQDVLKQEEAAERNKVEKGVNEAKTAVAQVKQCLENLDPAPGGDTDVQILQVFINLLCLHQTGAS